MTQNPGTLNPPISEAPPAILCVANWESNVGYAWWLIESFWVQIQKHFGTDYKIIIAYPSISTLPETIINSGIKCVEFHFRLEHTSDLIAHRNFIKNHNIRHIYFSDRPTYHWSYAFFRHWGVSTIAVHTHTANERTNKKWLNIYKKLWARLPFINIDVSIGATECAYRRLIEVNCLPKAKCHVAPNGLPKLDSEPPPYDLQKQFKIPAGALIIISTGRAAFSKGVDFALEVIAELVHKHQQSHIHYLYCGDGPDLDTFKSMAHTLGITEYVSFPGRVNNIESALAAAHIAFHPSKGEAGYSLSILEYMRSGLPVVIPNRTSVREATRHMIDGLIYEADDIASATHSLLQLIHDDALRIRLGKQAQESLRNQYALETTHTSLINILKKYIPTH